MINNLLHNKHVKRPAGHAMGWNEESYFRINNELNKEKVQKRSVTAWDSSSEKTGTHADFSSVSEEKLILLFVLNFPLTNSGWYWCNFTQFNAVMLMWNCCNWSWLKFSIFFSSTQTTPLWIKNSWNKMRIINVLLFPFLSHLDMSEVAAVCNVQTSDWKIKSAIQKIIYCWCHVMT